MVEVIDGVFDGVLRECWFLAWIFMKSLLLVVECW